MITSVANREIRGLRRLRTAENRARHGLVLVEGRFALGEVLRAGAAVDRLVTTPRAERTCPDLVRSARQAGARRIDVSDAVMGALCETATPPPVLAVVPRPQRESDGDARTWLLLDEIRDPRALGAVLRAAAACKAGSVAVTATCADPFASKVVRASAAAAWSMHVEHPADPTDVVARAEAAGFSVAALDDGLPAPTTGTDRLLVTVGPAARLPGRMRLEVSATEPALPVTIGLLVLLADRARMEGR